MDAAVCTLVKDALKKIEEEHPALEALFQQCSSTGTLPEAELQIFAHQLHDSIGVLCGGKRQAEAQLADLHAAELGVSRGFSKEAKAERKGRMATLKTNVAGYAAKLDQCWTLYMDKLKISLDMSPSSLPTLKASMPVAATSSSDSMQRLLGKLWIIDKAAAAGGDKKLQQLVGKKLNTAIGKYDDARTKATGVFVPLARCSGFDSMFALEDDG